MIYFNNELRQFSVIEDREFGDHWEIILITEN